MLWENLREEEFNGAIEASKGVCVIPVGAMERHGTHLPLGCDALKGIAFTNAAADSDNITGAIINNRNQISKVWTFICSCNKRRKQSECNIKLCI